MNRPRRAAAAAGIAKRKAFQKPSPKHIALLAKELANPNSHGIISTTPSNNNLHPNNEPLLRATFTQLYQDGGKSGIHRNVPMVYIQFVCEFVNKIHNRNRAGQIPVCAYEEANFFKKYYENFCLGRNTEATFKDLNENGLGKENFFKVRHLFLADRSRAGHIALIVISPQARLVDYLDSGIERHDSKMGVVFHLLAEHLGEDFKPFEWRVRQGHSPHQGDTDDCAVYVMTNAMFIALGYPIDYVGGCMLRRRQRIAIDLLNSASGSIFYNKVPGVPVPAGLEDFHYETADYWAGSQASHRDKGFESLNEVMLSILDEKVSARRGKYAHVESIHEMENICLSTPWHYGLENRVWNSLKEFVERVELRDERYKRGERDCLVAQKMR